MALTVLIAWTQVDVLASVIAEALRRTPDIQVVTGRAMRVEDVEALLSQRPNPDVLILVGSGVPEATALLQRHPSLVISRIAIGPDAVHFDLRKLGIEQLISMLRTLVSDRPAGVGDRLHVYEIEAPAGLAQSGAPRLVEVGPPAASLLKLAMAWIDAALLHFNHGRPDKGTDLPGLPLNRDGVNRLLAPAGAPLVAEGYDTTTALDRAAAAFAEALLAPDSTRQPLGALYHGCRLSSLEMQVLLLALAPELDVRYQQAFGSFNDDMARRAPSLPLVCTILGKPVEARSSLNDTGNLVAWCLLERDATLLPRADAPLRVDAFVVAWLLGSEVALAADPAVAGVIRATPWPGSQWQRRPADLSLAQRLAHLLSRHTGQSQCIALAGDTDGWRALIEAAAARASVSLVRVSSARLAAAGAGMKETAVRIARLVQLTHAIPVVDAGDAAALDAADAADAASNQRHLALFFDAIAPARRTSVVIAPSASRLIGALPRDHVHLLERDEPDTVVRGTVFDAAAADAGVQLDPPAAERLASKFPLSLAAVDDAIRLAAAEGLEAKPPAARLAALADAFRRIASPELPRFAQRIEPRFRLDDVVLPRDRRAQLDELISHVNYAATVLDAWGFGAQLAGGRGIAALFFGPSGTGKTMAAQAIARMLQTDLYLVDLARVVSKFIGETEKNLDAIFDDAERAGAVLLFDEADALFGKRSEVKDAHDRYANIEIAYLLQRMETFRGVAILTTNFRQNIDQAFLRRLRFVVEFPRPDAGARLAIWHKCLPKSAPVDRNLDFEYLARRLEITGGNIRQVTLRAAFIAAREAAPAIGMVHVIAAARAELIKLGMPATDRELAEYAERLEQPPARVA